MSGYTSSSTKTTKNLMKLFRKQYSFQTHKLKEDIISAIFQKIEDDRNGRGFLSCHIVDYKSFKIEGDRVEVERRPSAVNPFKSIGTIYYQFIPVRNGTNIKCTIEPYSQFALLIGLCLFSLFLIFFSVFVFVSLWSESLKALSIVVLVWSGVLGFSYIAIRYCMEGLEEYSKTILSDLGVSKFPKL